jgi:hypothetical protein
MSVLDRLRKRSARENGGDSHSTGATSPEDQLPISGYHHLDGKEVASQLRELSQVELRAVETYERSHRARPEVLNKLRYMRTSEPLPGYDSLASEQIAAALADADTETVKAVRNYERKFQRRRHVLEEAERVRPTSTPSANETRSREENVERVRAGVAVRAETAARLPNRQGSLREKGD